MGHENSFPRELTPLEKDFLLWLLPADRPGYSAYRPLVSNWRVAAPGRRGDGNFILSSGTKEVDLVSPLPRVFAYGVVEAAEGKIAVTIRERLDEQVEFEIMSLGGQAVPVHLNEKSRWTYSAWLPDMVCPECSGSLREVKMRTAGGKAVVLAACANDGKLWVYNEATGVNHPVPLTNFYNELMLQGNVRDPAIALNPRRFFSEMEQYSDTTLSMAFASYNKLKTKIGFEDPIQITLGPKQSLFQKLRARIMKYE